MKNKGIVKKIGAVLFATVITAGTLVGCGADKAEAESTIEKVSEAEEATDVKVEKDDYKVVRIGAGDANNLQLIDLVKLAQNNGFLEEELNAVGYTYEVYGFQGQGPEINTALMSNSIDVGVYGDFPALTSKASGADTTVIAIANPIFTYGVLASNDIQTPKDLEGKNVVVQQGTTLYYFWEQYAAKNGIDTSKVQVINSNVVDAVSLIQTGDADAFVSAYSSLKYYEATGIGHLVGSDDISSDGYSATVVNISNTFLKENPDVAVAINKALIRASEDAQKNPDAAYAILGNTYGDAGAPFAKAAYGFDETLSYFTPEITDEVRDYFAKTAQWMTANHILAAEVDLDTYLDNSYYEKAVSELGK